MAIAFTLVIILLSYFFPPESFAEETSNFWFGGTNVLRVVSLQTAWEIVVGRSTEIWTCRVEVDSIPESGLNVILGARINVYFRGNLEVRKEWSASFYPEDRAKLPMKIPIPIVFSVTEQDFNLTEGQTLEATLRTYSTAEVVLEEREVKSIGAYSSGTHCRLVNEHCVVDFLSSQLSGIVVGLLSVAAVMLTIGTLVHIRRKTQGENLMKSTLSS
jgi:hypothetical protein